ncbi:MAG TPA: ATP-dependent helicase C-terminal domain-containing protein [Polyangia bacterium]|nr:ATP-dependent helicase C-terminal domain-containing protein [Polyangia bacterium]
MKPLPIDPVLPEVVAALRERGAVVVEAPPGAGKTTRVPGALLDAGLAGAGEILVVEPRRLPARLAAERVAGERGEEVGQSVGYSVRFEERAGPATRIRFVTEGILLRRLLAEPGLRGVGAVVLDEFHERHVTSDLALALLKSLRAGARPDLGLCVMSATLDAEPVRAFLDDCPRVRSEGRAFEVAIDHLDEPDARPLPAQIAAAVRNALRGQADGDVLVFLPGAGEIRRAGEALAGLGDRSAVVPLHGEMSLADQNRAVRPDSDGRRKIILATNVAETSVTIDGVVAVIDAGLARIATSSPWSGLPTLALSRISQSSAIQRAGRAGRTRPGHAYRLYTRHDFEQRRRHDLPEVARTDLCEAVLALAAFGVEDRAAFPWFEAPPAPALVAAEELLARLGAIQPARAGAPGGRLTELGRRMLRFPVHPRLARLVCEGEQRGVAEEACLAAALIAERDIRERSRAWFGGAGAGPGHDAAADLLELCDLFQQAATARFARDRVRSLGLDARAVEMVDKARRQLVGIARADRRRADRSHGQGQSAPDVARVERALQIAALTGFPDRVARRRPDKPEVAILSAGGAAEIGPRAAGNELNLLVAIDAEERQQPGPGGGPGRPTGKIAIRLAAGIEAEWLLDLYADALQESQELAWNPSTLRVERASRLNYGAVVLDESVAPAPPSPEAARLLVDAAFAYGLERLDEPGVLANQLARIAFVRRLRPDAPLPALEGPTLRDAVAAACAGMIGFAELRGEGLAAILTRALPPEAEQLLRALAPPSLTLPGGRRLPIHYEPDRPPWIESRLQDFFGMAKGPAVGGGRVLLTIHLLAPNGRPVQVTSDLESFWQKHYPALRRELGRRYPRHAWPEDGKTAQPPPPKPPRARER